MTEALVRASGLVKSFVSLRQKVQAVVGVDFAVSTGELVGFIGPNGAGKSTTIKMMMGFIRPNHGTVSIGGAPAGSSAALQRIGFMPEHPSFPDTLSGMEWLSYAFRLHTGKAPRPQYLQARLVETGLENAGKRMIRTYSKGMLQRLGLAQALIADPDLLILDEPMSGLDPLGRSLFKELLLRHSATGKTIFFSSHILDDVENLCDRILMLDKGKVRLDTRSSELFANADLRYSVMVKGGASAPTGYLPVAAGSDMKIENVSGEQLQRLLAALVAEKRDILGIERQQIHLEEMFLALVREAPDA